MPRCRTRGTCLRSGAHNSATKEQLSPTLSKGVASSQSLKQLYRAQTIGTVASGQIFQKHSGFAVACGLEAVRASTQRLRSGFGEPTLPIRACSGFEVASEQPCRAHSGFKVASEQPFEHIVASKWFQSNHFERIVASKWHKWLLRVASEKPFRAHSGFEAAVSSALWLRSGSSGARA